MFSASIYLFWPLIFIKFHTKANILKYACYEIEKKQKLIFCFDQKLYSIYELLYFLHNLTTIRFSGTSSLFSFTIHKNLQFTARIK